MANTTPGQDEGPGLLRIAPELRNEICELTMPKATTIQLRAVKKPGDASTVHFQPTLPPLYYVCRQLHQEYPLFDYYTKNTFLFTDSIMKAPVLEAFVTARGEIVSLINSVKVNVTKSDLSVLAISSDAGSVYPVRFSLVKTESGTVIFTPSRDSILCLCETKQLAEQSSQRRLSLIAILQAFVAEYAVLDTQLTRTDHYQCADCSRTKITLPQADRDKGEMQLELLRSLDRMARARGG
ncbi:hypothetical protein LTR56_020242 [Elasticomyces elasticus]|nr:hypothetical protein LTR56_020242 [Elasticomyces elasticus]KAK3633453.1 hypothetical protein LTR22_020129 [Elasticomyces elasticus]KAK4907435.1 hypothetical protein LTR49_023538 [Elasticomyces elasticus]KAK5747843.1 hypothetical protein LTS12_022100 [Elasticomyces elasticus]